MRVHTLFLLANLLAAFSGGTILARGIGTLKGADFEEGSILAFLFGTVIGLAFYRLIPRRFSTLVSQWFSIAGAFSSAGLLLLFIDQADANTRRMPPGSIAIGFFCLFVMRFAFWFYSRVMRANLASEQEQGIAWVELGYFCGAATGLVFWNVVGDWVDMSRALGVDIALQLLAGGLDLFAYRALNRKEKFSNQAEIENKTETANSEYLPLALTLMDGQVGSTGRCWTLVAAVALLTIGTQVVLFDMAYHTKESFSPYILACFYIGVAVAAFVCRRWTISLWWRPPVGEVVPQGHGQIWFVILAVIGALLVLTVVIVRFALPWLDSQSQVGENNEGLAENLFLLVGVTLAAFVYECAALAAFERISEESRRYNLVGWVITIYQAMVIGAALSLLTLRFFSNTRLVLSAVAIGCWGWTLVSLRDGYVRWRR